MWPRNSRTRNVVLTKGATVEELVRALAAIGSTPRDVIAICRTCARPARWMPRSRSSECRRAIFHSESRPLSRFNLPERWRRPPGSSKRSSSSGFSTKHNSIGRRIRRRMREAATISGLAEEQFAHRIDSVADEVELEDVYETELGVALCLKHKSQRPIVDYGGGAGGSEFLSDFSITR